MTDEGPMARVRFHDRFLWHPVHNWAIDYPAGYEGTVKRACADEAIAKGVAVELDPNTKAEIVPAEPSPSEET